jgi:hypothetical protein
MPDEPTSPGPELPEPDADEYLDPSEVAAELNRAIRDQYQRQVAEELGKIPRPINWRTLTPEDLEAELLELNQWVDWLRHTYGLPPQILPPMWHRHPELLWELSALRQDWLFSYDPQAKGNQALGWHHDFAIARERLRDWVTISGTRLDRDRATRITPWPGGEVEDWTEPNSEERAVTMRTEDFLLFVSEQVERRREEQASFIDSLAQNDG